MGGARTTVQAGSLAAKLSASYRSGRRPSLKAVARPFPFLGPSSYRHTSYQKQTKNQWARDDPAFVVVCCVLLAGASAAYCVT